MNKRLTDKEIISLCHDVQIGTGGMDYADALTKIAEQLTLRGEQETPQEAWISVEQELPQMEGSVEPVWYLTFRQGYTGINSDKNGIEIDPACGQSFWYSYKKLGFGVTHYQLLPKIPVAPPLPYQEEKEGEIKYVVGDMVSWIGSNRGGKTKVIRTGKITKILEKTARIETEYGYRDAWIASLVHADAHANNIGHLGNGLCSIGECSCPGKEPGR